jgi:hypothetical protein
MTHHTPHQATFHSRRVAVLLPIALGEVVRVARVRVKLTEVATIHSVIQTSVVIMIWVRALSVGVYVEGLVFLIFGYKKK